MMIEGIFYKNYTSNKNQIIRCVKGAYLYNLVMNEFIRYNKLTYELIYIINFIYNLGDDDYL